jgi:DNA topoisomerase VI subunit A
VPIPVRFTDIEEIEIHSQTRFVLVIEKEATFANLISLGFCETHGPCILLTSKGFPDQVARRLMSVLCDMVQEGVFIKRLLRTDPGAVVGIGKGGGINKSLLTKESSWSSNPVIVPRPLEIPLLALVDCDPYGIEIYLTYRCGSVLSAYNNANLAAPMLKCLGQIPSDWDVFLDGCNLSSTISDANNPSHDRTLQEQKMATATSQEQTLIISKNENDENGEAEQLRSRFLEAFIPLVDRDRKKLERLLTVQPYIRRHARWRAQILRMLEVNAKTELQSLHLGSVDTNDSGGGKLADVGQEAYLEGSAGIGSRKSDDGGRSGSGGKGEQGQQRGFPSSALVLYLQRKLQDPASWL